MDVKRLFESFGIIEVALTKIQLDIAQAEKPEDPAGIFVAKLSLTPVIVDEQRYSFYGARVLPRRAVRAYRHDHGAEPYACFTGPGLMFIGFAGEQRIVWGAPRKVDPDSLVIIPAGVFHCFYNPGDKPVDFIFACPPGHLGDEDRFFADLSGLANPMPPIPGLAAA